MPRIALVSTSDTDLLSARACGADYLNVNPTRIAHTEMADAFAAADLIVARILGSAKSLCSGFDRIRRTGQPMVVLGGEQTPDASLMELSTVPIGVAAALILRSAAPFVVDDIAAAFAPATPEPAARTVPDGTDPAAGPE